jgi:hypothetical protein
MQPCWRTVIFLCFSITLMTSSNISHDFRDCAGCGVFALLASDGHPHPAKWPPQGIFYLSGCEASSAQGVEQNHVFVLELCATLAGATYLPPHSVFKAGPVEKKREISERLMLAHGIHQGGCTACKPPHLSRRALSSWRQPTTCSQRRPRRKRLRTWQNPFIIIL